MPGRTHVAAVALAAELEACKGMPLDMAVVETEEDSHVSPRRQVVCTGEGKLAVVGVEIPVGVSG